MVVWHYVNDYSHEVSDWSGDSQHPSLGNGTYYNGWLRAADISPERYVEQLLGKILTVGSTRHGRTEAHACAPRKVRYLHFQAG